MAGSNGKQKTVRDMILSLGLIGIAAAIVYIFIPHSDHAPDVKRVDYRVELLTARRAAPYPVAAPEGLARELEGDLGPLRRRRCSTPGTSGSVPPGGQYVQIEQSTQKPSDFVDTASQGAAATKTTQTIGGHTLDPLDRRSLRRPRARGQGLDDGRRARAPSPN
ncbi:DUF4245 domain-containing protein [Streptomyces sp. L7]